MNNLGLMTALGGFYSSGQSNAASCYSSSPYADASNLSYINQMQRIANSFPTHCQDMRNNRICKCAYCRTPRETRAKECVGCGATETID